MAVSYGINGTGDNDPSTIDLLWPASLGAGDYVLSIVTSGDSANSQPNTPTGWDFLGTSANTDGSWGNQTGPRRITVCGYEAVGGESGSTNFNIPATTNSVIVGRTERFDKTLASWVVAAYTDNYQIAEGAATSLVFPNVDLQTGDMLYLATAGPNASQAIAGQAFSATGITFGTVTEGLDNGNTTGNDIRSHACRAAVSSGSGTVTVTASFTVDHSCGAVLVVLRDTDGSTVEMSAALADALAASASATPKKFLTADLSDALAATAAATPKARMSASLSDSLTTSAAAAHTARLSATLTEALTATGEADPTARLSASISAALSASASGFLGVAQLSASLTASLAASASASAMARMSADLADALNASANAEAFTLMSASLTDGLTASASMTNESDLSIPGVTESVGTLAKVSTVGTLSLASQVGEL